MNSNSWRAFLLPVLLALVTGCGGGGSSTGPPSGGGGNPGGGGGPLSAPVIIGVSAGQAASGVDVAVVPPASNPPPNAKNLGTGNTAANTGTTISQGSTQTVLLFGPGLSGSMKVTLTGPNDIAISNVQSITATDNTPGVSFAAAVSSNAALGARTVILQDTKNDITTFTGGLEVIP